MAKTYYLKRVEYGSKKTPANKREYRICSFIEDKCYFVTSAVGTIDEIKKAFPLTKFEIMKND